MGGTRAGVDAPSARPAAARGPSEIVDMQLAEAVYSSCRATSALDAPNRFAPASPTIWQTAMLRSGPHRSVLSGNGYVEPNGFVCI